MKKMRNFLTLAVAAALTGILLTGCSTEADETTAPKAETAAQTEAASTTEKASEDAASGKADTKTADSTALAGKKISVIYHWIFTGLQGAGKHLQIRVVLIKVLLDPGVDGQLINGILVIDLHELRPFLRGIFSDPGLYRHQDLPARHHGIRKDPV